MNLVEFYQNLLAIGIELWVDGGKLCYDAPEDVLTSELLTEIKQYKEEIIHLLQKRTDTVRTNPLSHRQKALWFLYQLAPDSAAYNVAYPARLVSNVDIPALRQAAQALIERHPVLRTTYTAQQGEPVQTIQENLEVCFSVLEAVNWSQDDFHNWLISEGDRPFDLSNGPVLRFTLLITNILTDASAAKEVILLMTAHHIVVDFWSLELLVSELRVFYEAFKTGQEVAFPPQNQQYSYYVWWENQMLASQQGERLWNYWRDQLSGELPILNLPTDRPRPPVQTYKGASYSFILEEKLTHKLLKLALAEGVTLYTLLLAAFQVLLLRYTNQEDILIGSPMVGRSLTEFEKIVGYFTNPVVLRADLSGNPTFRELLCQVRSCVLGALEHQDYPFPLLVERLQPLRDPSRSPLYQVAFVWDRYHQNEGQVSLMDSDGLIVESITPESKGAPFDLDLTIFDVTGPLKGIWKYNTDLFDADTIERMAGHFQTLLTGIVANPMEPISALPLLSEVEQQKLLVEWNSTTVEYPSDQCIHTLFESQAQSTPDAVAVVYVDALCAASQRVNQQLTYQQLNHRANQLAHYLRSLGVGPETLVGICVERSLEMVVGLFGILKAGGAYVPLDPEYPTERKEFILADTQTSILLTQQHLATNLATNGIKVICLDADWEVIATQQICNLFSETTSLNLAYVIYTSGSTGKPKGTLIPHQGLVNYLVWCTQAYEVEQGAGTLVHSPLGFDLTITSLFSPLLVGKRVEILPEARDSDTLSHSLRHHSDLSLVKITPAHLELLNQQLSPKEAASRTRALIIGGENLLAESIAFWQEFAPETILVNEYGPTETVVGCCIYQVPTGQHLSGSVPIGRAIANTQIYILDSNLQPVPISVPGEIHIGGAGLARGYLHRPELTMEKFIPNPFSLELGARLYKTGDLARYLPDGNIEYMGRIDNQVKIRGFRIELGEIEAVLSQHPSVHSVVVTSRVDTPGDQRLVAYIVPQLTSSPTMSELRQFLKTKLPGYMVPSAFVILSELPLTPNGKIDRRALPKPELDSSLSSNYVAPCTPIEEMLTQIWAAVLKVEHVGIEDNFFTLGGHSLLATQLISRIRSSLKVELPLRSVFADATVAQMAQQIQQLQQLELKTPPLLPTPRNIELPLSFAQSRLWFLDQLKPNSAFYNIPAALRLFGELQLTALEQSFREIIARHEALRTNFITVDGQATQVIHTHVDWTLSIVDWQSLPTTEQEIAAQQLVITQALVPFDLANEPLFRATLVVLNQTEHILLVCMHHIVSDGWSVGVLVQELAALYNAYSQGQPSGASATRTPLASLPIQYADFTIWQRQWLQGDVLQSQLSYWLQQLANAPALLSLPTDRPRPAVQTFSGAHQKFTLCVELTQRLTKLSQQQGCTLFMTLLAAFDTLLYRYTGQSDILVGSPIANRNHNEVEGLIGFFVNTLVMRTNLAGNPSFLQLLNRVREMAMDAYAHQDLPFEMLVEVLQPERNLGHTPLFQVMFVLENAPISQLELTGLTVSPIMVESATAKFDLALAMEKTATGLVGVWEYNTDLFDEHTIKQMAGHFVTLLEGIVANPIQNLAQLPLLTKIEQQQLLVEWNDTQAEYSRNKCIHQLFEEQVERTPDAVAVVDENQQLTYHQLNCRANQLAHYLQTLGVKPDVLVGICVERSLEMMVGLLGILKAGGAYVPLDPDYPTDRLRFMLLDAQVSVLLSQQSLLDRLPEHQANQVCLDEVWEQIAQNNQDNPRSEVRAFDLANIIYTSGSTGKPKGVMVEHTGLCNLAQAQIQTFGLHSDSRVLQFASFSFDASISEIIMALGSGARLYLGTKDSLLPSMSLIERLRDYGITHITLPPSALAVMPIKELPALQTIIVAGEAISVELIRQWSAGRNFFNAYGPTEATVCATIAKCTDGDEKISIGRAIANTQIYILDEYLQPVPVGVPGELHIGGVGLARGYLNQRELTQEKFIPNPFSTLSHSRLYKTGDLARYLSDGSIEFLGRIDHQVKIRGYRIELGEVEAALSQLPEVGEAVVVVREDQPNNKRLVAYVVPQQKNLESSQEPENSSTDKVELWPSVAEYYVYDELLYYAMTNDHRRNDSYKVAINQLVKDKIVVEIGTGKDAILSRFCAEGGAKKIYAIERNEETCHKARACIEKLGLADKITVIHGDATLVDIPELADICVSEIVGAIGGSEGATVIINNARRFLKPDGLMIPERSVTKMAAVTLPDEILHNLKFSETPAHYTKEIFKQVGYPFDLRVCINKFPQANLLSTLDVLEDLKFNEHISPELSHEVKFEIQKNGRMDGFLVWLNLQTIAGEEIDILEHEHCWLPVYFPVFEPGIEVEYGDVIQAVCFRTLCENNLNPDYAIKGRLLKKNGGIINFEYVSYHYKNNFRQTPFYQRLFAGYDNAKNNHTDNLAQSLRASLKELLPDYMIPSSFVVLEKLPLTPNGKIDRRALPKAELSLLNEADYVMPNTEVGKIIAGIWQKALQVEKVGLYDNFFELGGHSLLIVRINQQLQEIFGLELSIVDMFNYPTIQNLSQYLSTKINKEDTIKQHNSRNYSESAALRNQQSQSRQQYRSKKKV